MQKRAREITDDGFIVEIWSWQDIWHELYQRPDLLRRIKPVYWPLHSALGVQRIAPSRLTHSADKLFGREKELAEFDAAWTDPATHVVTLVAWGGVGKTSLVARWAADLATSDYDGADYFDWSFYSQGTRDTATASADPFVDAALRFLGDEATADSAKSPWDKGARLAQLVAQRRMLLVLDGLEPLQHPPGPLAGELKDPAITSLLKGLAARNPGLCVVTTRESITDLAAFRASTAPEKALERLSTNAGVTLLKDLGVDGPAADLEQLVEDVRGHALTLNLMGRYLKEAHQGDVRRRDLVRLQDADHAIRGDHAFRVIEAYERWLAPRRGPLRRIKDFLAGTRVPEPELGRQQLAILRLLGLFDRPAQADCFAALRRWPGIRGLTDVLVELSEADWNLRVAGLVRLGLVVADAGDLDAHPLVRDHFGRQLREERPEAWKVAHSRLFDHLKDTAEHQPDTLAGLQPLYQAIVHGCMAGRQQEAYVRVYLDRIQRGTGVDGFYSTRELGAYGADLGAVACFFEAPWSRVAPSLTETDRAWLLAVAAFCLRALGRLTEAVEPIRAALQIFVEAEDWNRAAQGANNLSTMELTLGDIAGAVRDAKRSVDLADRSGDKFTRLASRTAHADALHQAGCRDGALALFREAEAMQAERQANSPLLYSLPGFRYCDLLITVAERAVIGGERAAGVVGACREVEWRASQALAWELAMPGAPLLDFAVHHLALGRARLYRSILEGISPDDAAAEIEEAVDGLRRAGDFEFVVRGLLTRAWLRYVEGDKNQARADLDEAREIAERGPMPLFLADVNLYRARLFHDRAALAEARRLMAKHGYWRRREEIEDLEAVVDQW